MPVESFSRRTFLGTSALAVAALAAGDQAAPAARQLIWGNLLHLSYNMWCDWDNPLYAKRYTNRKPDLRFDEPLWNDLLKLMQQAGMNLVIMDLGDGIVYDSHPEIAVRGAWTPKKLREELAKIRALGLEPIPKLNFSATHDTWMGKYSRQVSTDAYYAVCKDLIAEVCTLFDKPRFFHLGMDEETAENQMHFEYVVVRQFDLWWRDFLFLVKQVESAGVRPWIWSDYVWNHPKEFHAKMPRSVVQSNWYYAEKFDDTVREAAAYRELSEKGFDQIPTGSNYDTPKNFGLTVEYCRKVIDPARLLGFLQTPWRPTLPETRQRHIEAIEQVREARNKQV